MKAVIKKASNGQFYFVLKGKNGKVIATGETYHRKIILIKTIKKYFPGFIIHDV